MPLRNKLTDIMRFFNKNPRVPAKGMKFLANRLQEEDPAEIQKYLRIARHNLVKSQRYSQTHPLVRNITRLSHQVGKSHAPD